MTILRILAIALRKFYGLVITPEEVECGKGLLSAKELTMDIGKAVEVLKSGGKVRRYTWSTHCYLQIKEPTPEYPYESLLMYHERDYPHHWTPSKDELLATDWVKIS